MWLSGLWANVEHGGRKDPAASSAKKSYTVTFNVSLVSSNASAATSMMTRFKKAKTFFSSFPFVFQALFRGRGNEAGFGGSSRVAEAS